MIIQGQKFEKSGEHTYHGHLVTTWYDVVNHKDFKGLCAIVTVHGNSNSPDLRDIIVIVSEVAAREYYYSMKELAELCGSEYRVIQNQVICE